MTQTNARKKPKTMQNTIDILKAASERALTTRMAVFI